MENKSKGGYTKSQWFIFLVLGFTNLLTYMLYSMQAPIFPAEAQKRNATVTEFGLVFGSYELTQLIMSPIVGIYATKFGMFRAFNCGILVTGISTILFGCLQFIKSSWIFIIGALLLRIIEAIGATAIFVTIYTFVSTEFPDSIATTMGAMEGIVGIAFSIGPFVGSTLFQVGGFILPFSLIGGSLIGIGGMVYYLLHSISDQTDQIIKNSDDNSQNGIFELLRNVPSIYFYMFMVAVAATNVGFILTLLEVHLEEFDLKPMYIGLVFLLFGVVYGTSAPIFSRLCGFIIIPELVPLTGTILYIIGFTLVGPAVFIPLKPSLGLTLGGVTLMGCAGGCILSSGFILSIMATVKIGFSDGSQVSSLSGLWLSSSSFGVFIGPIIAGVLYDFFSFPIASLSMIGLDSVQAIFLIIFIVWKYKNPIKIYPNSLTTNKNNNEEQIPLIRNENINKKFLPLKVGRKGIKFYDNYHGDR